MSQATALLSAADLARVGAATEPVTETVTRREIRRYAVATRQRAPKYLAGEEAPPMFFQRYFETIPSLESLQPSGGVVDALTQGLPLERQMAGGSDIAFHRPIRPGDVLTATRTLTGLTEKQGRSGPAIFCTIEMRVVDDSGAPVATETYTRILR